MRNLDASRCCACSATLRGPWRGSRRAAGLCAAAQHPPAAASTPPAHAAAPATPAGRAEAARWPKHAKDRDFCASGLAGAEKPSRRPGVGARRAAPSPLAPPAEAVPSFSPRARMVRTWKAAPPSCGKRQISPFWRRGRHRRIALKESNSLKSSHLLDSPLGPAGRPSEANLPTKGLNKLLGAS